MRKFVLVLSFVLCANIVKAQDVSDFQKQWRFGGMTGITVGYSGLYDRCDSNDSCGFNLGFLNDVFNTIPVMAVAEYRFKPKWSFRGALGIEIYNIGEDQTDIYYESMPRVFPAAEALLLYHFRKEDKLFHPYFSMGARFPAANLAFGLGNQFHLKNKSYFFLETMGSFLPTQEFRGAWQLGFLYKF